MRWATIGILLAAAPCFAEPQFGFVRAWSAPGGDWPQFAGVWSIAVSRTGFVYVADGGRIGKFDLDGHFIAGVTPLRIGEASALSVSPDNRLYFTALYGEGENVISADSTLTDVHGFLLECARECAEQRTYSGCISVDAHTALGVVALDARYDEICGPVKICNLPYGPRSVAVDHAGSIFLSHLTVTEGGGEILKFASDGHLMGSWTGSVEGGELDYPSGMAVDEFDRVYVVDRNHNQIQVFTNNGYFITAWGSYGSGPGQFSRPTAIALDKYGNVYVADSGNFRVQKFSAYVGVEKKSWSDVRKIYR